MSPVTASWRSLSLLVAVLCSGCRCRLPADADSGTPRVDAGPSARLIAPPRACGSSELCAKACEGGQGGACYEAALFAFAQRGPQRDLAQVGKWAGLACDRGDGRGCARAARAEEAGRWLPVQCEAGEVEACELLVTWARDADAGTIIPFAVEKTFALLEIACARTEPWACGRLGSLLARGRLGKVDPSRGVKLLEQACEQGVAGACLEAALIFSRGLPGIDVDPARAAKYGRSARELSGTVSE